MNDPWRPGKLSLEESSLLDSRHISDGKHTQNGMLHVQNE
jgi:hypothetical protein